MGPYIFNLMLNKQISQKNDAPAGQDQGRIAALAALIRALIYVAIGSIKQALIN